MFDRGYESIPSILDDLEPGPELGGILACIEVTEVSPYDRVTVMRAHHRQRSFYDAQLYRDMTAIVAVMDDDNPQCAAESAAAEIRVALHLTRRATDVELAFALELHHRLPVVWDALVAGTIDLRRAKTIGYHTTHLPDPVARRVVERVIEAAPTLTTGQLAARIDRICIEADPGYAHERYTEVVKGRRVVTERSDTGAANLLGLDLPAHRAAAASRRINHLARSLKRDGETRSMDQLRADVYLDLLIGEQQNTNDGGVHIQIDLDTLAGLTEHPGELNGYGPVVADVARQVATEQQDAEWRWAVTDPVTGHVLHDGMTRRRPTAQQRRTVQARHPTCVFPGCRMPAVDCDLDHTTRWADGGKTRTGNLAPLCRHDHPIKDTLGWTYQRLPNGRHRWTSRLGHTYTTSSRPP